MSRTGKSIGADSTLIVKKGWGREVEMDSDYEWVFGLFNWPRKMFWNYITVMVVQLCENNKNH